MDRGYVKLWRKSFDSPIFANKDLWYLWSWCLLKATYIRRHISLTTGRGSTVVELSPGQFVFGRNAAAVELKDKPTTVYKRMKKLELLGKISIKSDTHYSIITICNWDKYQCDEKKKEQPSDNQVTTKEQPSDTNKKVKKVKNKYGTFENVFLSPEEKEKLDQKFNGTLDGKLNALSEYMKSTGKRYKSHYATILSWDRRDQKTRKGDSEWI